jgi:hypothetical protein
MCGNSSENCALRTGKLALTFLRLDSEQNAALGSMLSKKDFEGIFEQY